MTHTVHARMHQCSAKIRALNEKQPVQLLACMPPKKRGPVKQLVVTLVSWAIIMWISLRTLETVAAAFSTPNLENVAAFSFLVVIMLEKWKATRWAHVTAKFSRTEDGSLLVALTSASKKLLQRKRHVTPATLRPENGCTNAPLNDQPVPTGTPQVVLHCDNEKCRSPSSAPALCMALMTLASTGMSDTYHGTNTAEPQQFYTNADHIVTRCQTDKPFVANTFPNSRCTQEATSTVSTGGYPMQANGLSGNTTTISIITNYDTTKHIVSCTRTAGVTNKCHVEGDIYYTTTITCQHTPQKKPEQTVQFQEKEADKVDIVPRYLTRNRFINLMRARGQCEAGNPRWVPVSKGGYTEEEWTTLTRLLQQLEVDIEADNHEGLREADIPEYQELATVGCFSFKKFVPKKRKEWQRDVQEAKELEAALSSDHKLTKGDLQYLAQLRSQRKAPLLPYIFSRVTFKDIPYGQVMEEFGCIPVWAKCHLAATGKQH